MLAIHLFFFLQLTKQEYTDPFGVEYENQNSEVLTGTTPHVVDYTVPSSCSIILGGESADYSSFRGCKTTIQKLQFAPNSQLTCIYPFVFLGTTIRHLNFSNCLFLTTINESLCQNCRFLEILVLPPLLETVGPYSFYSCISLNQIEFPSTLKILDEASFFYTSSLKTVIMHEDSQLQTIGSNSFIDSKLTEFYLPRNLSSLTAGSFLYTNISKFTIHPENVSYKQ